MFIIIIAILGGVTYYKYMSHMEEFNADRAILSNEKAEYNKNEVKAAAFEKNETKELTTVKEKNEKIENTPENTNVDFRNGDHILTI